MPGFLGRAVALEAVAVPAGGDHVHPGVPAAARQRGDVVARQPEIVEVPAAIGADLAVAPEQLAVVERRHLVEALRRHRLALDGDDRMRGDAGALAGGREMPPLNVNVRSPIVQATRFLA